MEVSRFSGQLGGESSLIARWSLFSEGGQEALMNRQSRFGAPAGAPGYEAMVAAMSQTVADLRRDIAAAIGTRGPSVSACEGAPGRACDPQGIEVVAGGAN